jgi:hypothetical protein
MLIENSYFVSELNNTIQLTKSDEMMSIEDLYSRVLIDKIKINSKSGEILKLSEKNNIHMNILKTSEDFRDKIHLNQFKFIEPKSLSLNEGNYNKNYFKQLIKSDKKNINTSDIKKKEISSEVLLTEHAANYKSLFFKKQENNIIYPATAKKSSKQMTCNKHKSSSMSKINIFQSSSISKDSFNFELIDDPNLTKSELYYKGIYDDDNYKTEKDKSKKFKLLLNNNNNKDDYLDNLSIDSDGK